MLEKRAECKAESVSVRRQLVQACWRSVLNANGKCQPWNVPLPVTAWCTYVAVNKTLYQLTCHCQ